MLPSRRNAAIKAGLADKLGDISQALDALGRRILSAAPREQPPAWHQSVL